MWNITPSARDRRSRELTVTCSIPASRLHREGSSIPSNAGAADVAEQHRVTQPPRHRERLVEDLLAALSNPGYRIGCGCDGCRHSRSVNRPASGAPPHEGDVVECQAMWSNVRDASQIPDAGCSYPDAGYSELRIRRTSTYEIRSTDQKYSERKYRTLGRCGQPRVRTEGQMATHLAFSAKSRGRGQIVLRHKADRPATQMGIRITQGITQMEITHQMTITPHIPQPLQTAITPREPTASKWTYVANHPAQLQAGLP